MKIQAYMLLILGFILLNGTVYAWDISAQFTVTDFEYKSNQLQIFGNIAKDGKTYYAEFDGNSDDTYTKSYRLCSYNEKYYYYPDAWDIERKYIAPNKYKILVRGGSDADCGRGQPQNSGWIKLNPESGWKITKINKCSVSSDSYNSNNKLIDTYCEVNKEEGIVTWQSGSNCGGCCLCPDGAGVNIEIIVEKNATIKPYCGDGSCKNISVKLVIETGDNVTITIAGMVYIVRIVDKSDSKIVIEVDDGISKVVQAVQKNNSYIINGLGIYVNEIYQGPNNSGCVLTLGEDNLTCPYDCHPEIIKKCPTKIVTEFDKSVYYVGDKYHLSVRIYDRNNNPIPNQKFWAVTYINGSKQDIDSANTNSQGIYDSKGTIDESILGTIKFVTYINKSNCPYTSDTDYLTVLPKNETAYCGDGICNGNETPETCSEDCKRYCTDSDKGIKFYIKGITESCYIKENGENCKVAYDFCKDNKTLTEYYCEGSKIESQSYSCLDGCKEGACIMVNETNNTIIENITKPVCGDNICENSTVQIVLNNRENYTIEIRGVQYEIVFYIENMTQNKGIVVINNNSVNVEENKDYVISGLPIYIYSITKWKDQNNSFGASALINLGESCYTCVEDCGYCPPKCMDGICDSVNLTIVQNETKNIKYRGKEYKITYLGYSNSTHRRKVAIIDINGVVSDIKERNSIKIAGVDLYFGGITDSGKAFLILGENCDSCYEDCGPCPQIPEEQNEFHTLELYKGWNLISLPVNKAISLSKIKEYCEVVPYYGHEIWMLNPKTKKWEHPTILTPGYGYYINVQNDCKAIIQGKRYKFEKQKIYKGWNIITPGNNSLGEILGTCKNHLIPYNGYIVWRWNPKTNSWEHPTKFELGKGYYILSDTECELLKNNISLPTSKFLWK